MCRWLFGQQRQVAAWGTAHKGACLARVRLFRRRSRSVPASDRSQFRLPLGDGSSGGIGQRAREGMLGSVLRRRRNADGRGQSMRRSAWRVMSGSASRSEDRGVRFVYSLKRWRRWLRWLRRGCRSVDQRDEFGPIDQRASDGDLCCSLRKAAPVHASAASEVDPFSASVASCVFVAVLWKYCANITLSSAVRYGTRWNCWEMKPIFSARGADRAGDSLNFERSVPLTIIWLEHVSVSSPPRRSTSVAS